MKTALELIISEEIEKKSGKLFLPNLNLTEIPAVVNTMPWLTYLSICNNCITTISNVSNLQNLKILIAYDNEINEITEISQLRKLSKLDLASNKISDISGISKLSNLNELYLSKNPISNLEELTKTILPLNILFLNETNFSNIQILYPYISSGLICSIGFFHYEKVIYLQDCPIPEGYKSLIESGHAALLNFLREMEEGGSEILYEARLLILGEAGSGKTTLARKLIDPSSPMPDEIQDTTKGIDIQTKTFLINGNDRQEFKMNIWDFGGQLIYHSTHQFFLTQNCLYVILSNGRYEEDPEVYWLPIQKLLGKNSPVIIIINQKGDVQYEPPVNQLRAKFDNIKDDLIKIDLSQNNTKFKNLASLIEYRIQNLPLFTEGETIPRRWANIRKKLTEVNKNYMLFDEYEEICKQYGVNSYQQVIFNLEKFNVLGVVIFFNKPFLNKYIFLNKMWLTKPIYALFDHTRELVSNGKISLAQVTEFWKSTEYESIVNELMKIMQEFDLCFQINENPVEYILPKLIKRNQPTDIQFDYNNCITFCYEYDVMPRGILQALIVRKSSYLISHEHIWYNGCFFILNDSTAVVKTESKNKIQIMSSGTQKGLLLELLSHEIDMINKSFSFTFEINVKKQIQCICKLCLTSPTPKFHDFNEVIDRLNRGNLNYVECLKSDEKVLINELLNYTFDRGKNKLLLDKKSVFISYSKNDIAHLTNFKKHLKVISSKVNIWDDNTVKVGDKWEDKINELISIANIIVFLISADMYSTDFIMEVELPQALQRQKNDPDNVRIIPVIIKECLWQETILAVFNGSPNKGVPITNFENSDAAWTKVVSEINNLLNDM